MSTSSSLLVGAASVSLCLGGYRVPVGVGWLSHCHSLDVMRKSTLDLPLWSASLEDSTEPSLKLAPSTTRVSRGRLTPRRIHISLRPTVILTDWCNKNLTSLSQMAHHRPVLVGEGNGRERLGVGDTESVVCVCFRRGGGCCEIQEEVQHFS